MLAVLIPSAPAWLGKRNASIQPSFGDFASIFEKEWGCWRVPGAEGMLEDLSGDADTLFPSLFSLFLRFLKRFSFPLLQDTESPNARLFQNTSFPQFSLSLPHSTTVAVQPLWSRERLGWKCPSTAGEPNCPWVCFSVANPHLCRYHLCEVTHM